MTTVSSTGSTTATTATTTTATDPASIGSQLVTSLGLGTGIDMSALAGSIATATYADQTANLATSLTKVQLQISEAGQLKSDLLTLTSSLASAVNTGNLASSPTVTNSTVATATLPLGTSGAASSYSLEVTALAAPQVLTSPTYASETATTGSGTLTLNFGTISNGSFAADSTKTPVTVTIPTGATLDDVANAINGAGAGVTAYVATNSGTAQLVLKGATGADSAFTLSATEADGDPGLSALAWDPSTGDAGRLATSAGDAQYKLDGIARTSATNQIANAAPSLSLNLTGTNAGDPTSITYSDPSANISSTMQNFVTALNSLVAELNTDLSATSGGLYNDTSAQTMARSLAALPGLTIMPNAAAGAPSSLGDLGLSVNKDGTYALDATKLSSALAANPTAVAAMFGNGLHGVYDTLETTTLALTSDTDPGSLAGAVTRYTTLQTSITTQQAAVATQQSALRDQLVASFADANTSVAQSKSTLSFLQNQIAAWNTKTS